MCYLFAITTGFLKQVRKAKFMKFAATFYNEGSRVFEFGIHGLRANW
jgi:hypothetical protein